MPDRKKSKTIWAFILYDFKIFKNLNTRFILKQKSDVIRKLIT